jgi:hypothetical protein
MARRRERPALRPRVVPDAELAAYIGRSVSWLSEHRMDLERQGFPARLPVVGGNDLVRVDEWLDQLCAQTAAPVSPDIARLIERATRNVVR